MAREYKKYGIRAARRPIPHPCLASTVHVVNDETGGHGYCYITFGESLVNAAGKILPRGIAPHDPAYLRVRYDERRKRWIISTGYVSNLDESYCLWETDVKPSWLTTISRRSGNGKNNQKTEGAGSDSAGAETSASGAEARDASA